MRSFSDLHTEPQCAIQRLLRMCKTSLYRIVCRLLGEVVQRDYFISAGRTIFVESLSEQLSGMQMDMRMGSWPQSQSIPHGRFVGGEFTTKQESALQVGAAHSYAVKWTYILDVRSNLAYNGRFAHFLKCLTQSRV